MSSHPYLSQNDFVRRLLAEATPTSANSKGGDIKRFCLCGIVVALTVILVACSSLPPTPTRIPPTATQLLPTATTFILPATVTPVEQVNLNPSPRGELPLAYNPKTNQVIFFGGSTGNSNLTSSMNGETWIYDIAANTWTEIQSPSAPTPRDNVGLAYDAESDRIILFGGSIPKYMGMRDTWAFDMSTNTWTEMNTKGPPFHHGLSMVYDIQADRMLIFGGYKSAAPNGGVTNDIWAYDYNTNTWTELKPAVNPPGRNFQAMVYDSKANREIMWGGWCASTMTTTFCDPSSVWIYDYNSNTWEERKTDYNPSGRIFHTLSYDPKSDLTILYGGYTNETSLLYAYWDFGTNSSETWAYDYNLNKWMLLEPAANPGPLSFYGQVYLSSIDRVMLFGGKLDVDKYSDKTWLYDFDANTWTEVTPSP